MNAIDVAQYYNITIWGHNLYLFISISTRCNQSIILTSLLVIFYCVLNLYRCLYPLILSTQQTNKLLAAQTPLLYVQVQMSIDTQ